jgi:hypothetical protein
MIAFLNTFIPPGHIDLERAVEAIAKRWHPEEAKEASSGIVRLGAKRRSVRMHPDKMSRLREKTWKALLEKLYMSALRVSVVDDEGTLHLVPARFWGSVEGRRSFEPNIGKALFAPTRLAVENGSGRRTYGAPVVAREDLEAFLDGKPMPARSEMLRHVEGPSGKLPDGNPDPVQSASASPAPDEPRDKGGAPFGYDWDEIWAEIVRRVHDEGLPEKKAHLVEYVQEWCEDKYGKHPSPSSLKPKIALIFKAFGKGGGRQ